MTMPRSFHIATPEEIKQAKTTDIYFVRTLEVLKAKGRHRQKGYAEFTLGGLPGDWPWGIFCGLEEVVTLMQGLPINLWALPEGTLFRARDEKGIRVPVMAVEGAYGDFCLYETPMLGLICQASGVATKAARIRQAAGDGIVLSFGTRRMHPVLAPMLERAAFIGGSDGASNVLGSQAIGQAPRGTMPHALIIAFGDAVSAWKAFDEVIASSVPRIALIDTYSDEKEEALAAARVLGKRLQGVRLDTPSSRRGDFPELVREVRWELDLRGYSHVKIFVSGGLDEEEIPALRQAGADGFGVGTAMANARTFDFAMDLVEMDGKPCAKRGKLSGRKIPWRCPACLGYRVTATRAMAAAIGSRTRHVGAQPPACLRCRRRMASLFHLVLKQGKAVERPPRVEEIRRYAMNQLEKIQHA